MSEQPVTCIMAAVDGSPQSLAALRGAAALASDLDAELVGLFVEDVTLLQLAELPIAREIHTFTATVREMDPEQVRQHLRRQSRRARRATEVLAVRREVSWRFSVRRGPVVEELLEAMSDADLIVLGRGSEVGQRRLGSTARAILLETTRPVLMLDQPLPPEPHALVLYNGSDRAQKTLDLAAQIVRAQDGYLTLACAADTSTTVYLHQRRAFQRLREQGGEAMCRWLIRPTVDKLAEVARAEAADLIAVPGDVALLRGGRLARLLEEIHVPVLVVR